MSYVRHWDLSDIFTYDMDRQSDKMVKEISSEVREKSGKSQGKVREKSGKIREFFFKFLVLTLSPCGRKLYRYFCNVVAVSEIRVGQLSISDI